MAKKEEIIASEYLGDAMNLKPRSEQQQQKDETIRAEKLETDSGRWTNEKVGVFEPGGNNMNAYDYARAASVLTDIAGVAGTAFFGAGNIAAAGTGLVSSGLEFAADLEDGFDAGDVGNFLVNGLLDVGTLIPGIGSGAKFAKVGRGLKKIMPIVLQGVAIAGSMTAMSDAKRIYDKAEKNGWSTLNMKDYTVLARAVQGAVMGGRIVKNNVVDSIAYTTKGGNKNTVADMLKAKRSKQTAQFRKDGMSEADILKKVDSDKTIDEKAGKMWNKLSNWGQNKAGFGVKPTLEMKKIQKGTFEEIGLFGKAKNIAIKDAQRRAKGLGILNPSGSKQHWKANAKNWKIPGWKGWGKFFKGEGIKVVKDPLALPPGPAGPLKPKALGMGQPRLPAGSPLSRMPGNALPKASHRMPQKAGEPILPKGQTMISGTKPKLSALQGARPSTVAGAGAKRLHRASPKAESEPLSRALPKAAYRMGPSNKAYVKKSVAEKTGPMVQKGKETVNNFFESITRLKSRSYNRAAGSKPATPEFYKKTPSKGKITNKVKAKAAAQDPMKTKYKGKEIDLKDIVNMSRAEKKKLLKGGFRMTDGARKVLLNNESDIMGMRNGGKLVQKFEGGGRTDIYNKNRGYYYPSAAEMAQQKERKEYTDEDFMKEQQIARRDALGISRDENVIVQGKLKGDYQIYDTKTHARTPWTQWDRERKLKANTDRINQSLETRHINADAPTPMLVPRERSSIRPMPFDDPNQDLGFVNKTPQGFVTIQERMKRLSPKNRAEFTEQMTGKGGYRDDKGVWHYRDGAIDDWSGGRIHGAKLDKDGKMLDFYVQNKEGDIVTGAQDTIERRAADAERAKAQTLVARQGMAKMESDADAAHVSNQGFGRLAIPGEDEETRVAYGKETSFGAASAMEEYKRKNQKDLQEYASNLGDAPTLSSLLPETSKLKVGDVFRPNDAVQLGLLAAAAKPVKADFEETPLPVLSTPVVRGLPKSVRDRVERQKAEIRSVDMDTSDPNARRNFLLQKVDSISKLESDIAAKETDTIQASRLAARQENTANRQLMHQARAERTQQNNQRSLLDAQQKAKAKSTLLQGLGTLSSGIQDRVDQKKTMDKTMQLMGAKYSIDMLKTENQLEYDKVLYAAQTGTDPNAATKLKLLSKKREGLNDAATELIRTTGTI